MKSLLVFVFSVAIGWAVTPFERAIIDNNLSDVTHYLQSSKEYTASSKENSPFLLAVRLGRIHIAQAFIDAGVDAAMQDHTAMRTALSMQNIELLNVLNRYDDVRNWAKYSHDGSSSLLMKLLLNRKYQSVVWLVNQGVGFRKEGGLRPFVVAIAFAPLDVIQAFVQNQANINKADDYLGTPLAMALASKRLEVVRYLLNNSAKVTNTLLFEAVKQDNIELVKLLGAHTTLQNMHVQLINQAIYQKSYDIARYLIDNGVPLNSSGEDSALFTALKKEAFSLAEAIVDKKYTCRDESAALFEAIRHNQAALVGSMLHKGVPTTMLNDKEHTPVYMAMRFKAYDIVRMLLNYRIDIENVDDKGNTLLFYAIQSHQNDIVKALIEKGANIKAINDQERTLMYECVASTNFEAYTMLKNKGVLIHEVLPLDEQPIYLSIARNLEHFFYDLYQGHIPSTDDELNTLLHIAAKHDRANMIRYMVLDGMAIDVRNAKGETALMIAAKHGSLKSVAVLASMGANINAQDDRDISVQGWANKNNHTQVHKWLEVFSIKEQERLRKLELMQESLLIQEPLNE